MGILVIFFAAILLSDSIMTTFYPGSMFLSSNDVKGIAGMVFVIVAIFMFVKARE